MNLFFRCAALALFIISFPVISRADIVIGFNPDASLSGTNVQVGSTFSVNLYYVETTTSLAATNGLFSFGTRGTFSSSILQFTTGNVDAAFPTVGGGANPDGSVAGQVDVFGASPAASPNASSIHLATLNFMAIAPGTTTISFGDLDLLFDDFSLDDALTTSLDPLVFGATHPTHNFTVNVSAVPEPSCVAAIVMLFGSFAIIRLRKIGYNNLLVGLR